MTAMTAVHLVLVTACFGITASDAKSDKRSSVDTIFANNSSPVDSLLDYVFSAEESELHEGNYSRRTFSSARLRRLLLRHRLRSQDDRRKKLSYRTFMSTQDQVFTAVHKTQDSQETILDIKKHEQERQEKRTAWTSKDTSTFFDIDHFFNRSSPFASSNQRDIPNSFEWTRKRRKNRSNIGYTGLESLNYRLINIRNFTSSKTYSPSSVTSLLERESKKAPLQADISWKLNTSYFNSSFKWLPSSLKGISLFPGQTRAFYLQSTRKYLKSPFLKRSTVFRRRRTTASTEKLEELKARMFSSYKKSGFLTSKSGQFQLNATSEALKFMSLEISGNHSPLLSPFDHENWKLYYIKWQSKSEQRRARIVAENQQQKVNRLVPSLLLETVFDNSKFKNVLNQDMDTSTSSAVTNEQVQNDKEQHSHERYTEDLVFTPTSQTGSSVITSQSTVSIRTDQSKSSIRTSHSKSNIRTSQSKSSIITNQSDGSIMSREKLSETEESKNQSSDTYLVARRLSRSLSGLRKIPEDGSLPVSNYKDIYRVPLYSDFLPNIRVVSSIPPQPVSLKVIVHLSISRGYERVLESAISMGSREFWRLRRYIEPRGVLVRLKGDKPRDILQAFCENILEPNTTAVFHLVNPFFHTRSWSSAQYVSNLLSTLDMPIITWGPEYIGTTDKKDSELLQLNISPTLHHQAQAMLEVLRHYNWTHFCVVYTPVPGHDAFITAVRILVSDNNGKGGKNGFKYEQYSITGHVAVSNASDKAAINKDLRVLTRTETRVILLYCVEGDTLNILQEATKLGLMTEEYLWFLTFEAVNKNKQLNANNLPLGLLGIYYEYREDEMEEAIKTAVAVWFRGLNESVVATSGPDGDPTGLPWSMPSLECQSSKYLMWKDGHKFYSIMRNVSFNNVAFNELGQLKFKDISIVNVQPPAAGEEDQKWRQVGRFTADGIQMRHITWPGDTIHPPLGKPKRHSLRIVTREEPPFVEYRELTKNGSCGHFSYVCHVYEKDENEMRLKNVTSKRCCTGLSIDFLHRLSQALNFEFYLYEVEDFQWGSQNPDGTWNGIVGDLRCGRADMAVASMTIDEDRSRAVDFSVPYMETGITFMVAIRDGAVSATAFLEPYDYPSWCLILVCSVHVTGASIFVYEWFSPYGLDHGRRLSSKHRMSLFRTFWMMWAMLFGASVTTDTPRAMSSKFVSNIWALFALVFSASYTANLAAFMITKEVFYDLSGMQDWRLQNPHAMAPPFRFATIPNGTAENNIKKNNLRMYEYMKKYSQRSVEQAMEALKKQQLHAFIYDASVLEYQEGKDKDCRLITVGNWYATTGYGVAFPFHSPWLERVNNVILKLQNEGEMERLKEFWLAGACHTKRKKNTNNRGIGNGVSSTTLGILNFTSAFIFLAAGTGLAILTFLLEYVYFSFGRKRLSSWDKKGCCALISLSMGMSLSFQKSVHKAWDISRKSKQNKCSSAACETNLWKANHELRLARSEISRLQSELARLTLEGSASVVWRYDPVSTSKSDVNDHSMWNYANQNAGDSDEEKAVRVTLL